MSGRPLRPRLYHNAKSRFSDWMDALRRINLSRCLGVGSMWSCLCYVIAAGASKFHVNTWHQRALGAEVS